MEMLRLRQQGGLASHPLSAQGLNLAVVRTYIHMGSEML